MTKVAILFIAVAALAAAAASPSRAQAESLSVSCQSVNAQTICLRSSGGASTSLSCQTTNGRTVCVGSGGLVCTSDDRGRLGCRGGDASTQVEIHRSSPPSEDDLDNDGGH